MPPVGFETTISEGERPQARALDRATTGTGWRSVTEHNLSHSDCIVHRPLSDVKYAVGPVREHQVRLGSKHNLHIEQHCYVSAHRQPATKTTTTASHNKNSTTVSRSVQRGIFHQDDKSLVYARNQL